LTLTATTLPVPTAAKAARVLVVDDNPTNSKFMGVLLSRLTCEVLYAENGQQAIDRVIQNDLDLILMDINMPVMNGLSATRAIRVLGGSKALVPIIVITADTTPEVQVQAMEAGATSFMTKPVQIAKFRELVAPYLTR